MKKKIVVLGFMGSCPIAGVIWQHIHYIVGLQRLGHDVYYVEDTSRYPYNPAALETSEDFSYATQTIATLAKEYGFEKKWAYCARFCDPFQIVGMERSTLLELLRTCDAALNICGSHDLNEDLALIPRLIYVESDPGLEQIKVDQQNEPTLSFLQHHSHLFTFGENIGVCAKFAADDAEQGAAGAQQRSVLDVLDAASTDATLQCASAVELCKNSIGTPAFPVPTHGLTWLPTRQPIVTDLWCAQQIAPPPSPEALYTSICNWSTSGKKDIVWRDSQYLWSKSLEFLKFCEAPKKSGITFELATDINTQTERELFLKNHWKLILPHDLSTDWNAYRTYIQHSFGEFTCAKDQYIRLNTGWFSDRSACYLAAGRPVITQQTGFTNFYGGRYGLLAFSTMEEIVEATRAIAADYKKHSQAALEIAREFFEAEKVLRSLLERAEIC